MTHTFESEVSIHSWLLWPTVLCSINWQTTCLASYMREIHKYYTSKSIYTMQGTRKFFWGEFWVGIRIKVARWKKVLCIYHHTANLNFRLLSLSVYLFKNCPSQFLSHCELAETVFLRNTQNLKKSSSWFSQVS